MNNPIYCSLKRVIFFIILIALVAGKINSQWALQQTSTQFPIFSVFFINANTGFISSNSNNLSTIIGGEIFRTTNGGLNWSRVLLDSNFRCHGFFFTDNNTGFAVGGSYSMIAYIYKTTDNGINWQNITPSNIHSSLFNIVFTNSNTGYLGGIFGVYKTTNTGNNWEQIFSGFNFLNHSWSKVVFTDANNGYFLADSGRVYKTMDAGSNWVLTRSGGALYFDIKFLNVNTGFIAGQSGTISKTTDGGSSWIEIPINPSNFIYSIYFANLNTGYAGGFRYVNKTTDGGINWTPVFDSVSRSIYSLYFTDANTGYLASDTGKVYKTSTGGELGIQPVDPSVPVTFNLFQNYPNPFNPSTKIKFDIPKISKVKLSVYDALGREIETLVNESLQPGTYEVNWNAGRLSSGIYFYKLFTNDFSMVKKMSLIK
jgi:photosystem II stability/assembly factor-like uncharacterized protein